MTSHPVCDQIRLYCINKEHLVHNEAPGEGEDLKFQVSLDSKKTVHLIF